mgnify:CR=1 FL=1
MIWVLFIGTMALLLWAAARVNRVYKLYNLGVVRSGIAGAEVAAENLRRKGIRDIKNTEGEGLLLGGNRSRD